MTESQASLSDSSAPAQPRGPATVPGSASSATRIWTIPNVLSVLRLLGIPLFCWLAIDQHADVAAVVVLGISGFTDWLDGKLARALNQYSRLGELLDPVADRLYILAALVVLGVRDVVPWWLAILLVGRDVVLFGLFPALRRRGLTALPVHVLGKAATLCLLYAFPLLLLGEGDGFGPTVARVIGWAFTAWGTALYWWAGALYVEQFRRVIRETPVPRGGSDVRRAVDGSLPAETVATEAAETGSNRSGRTRDVRGVR